MPTPPYKEMSFIGLTPYRSHEDVAEVVEQKKSRDCGPTNVRSTLNEVDTHKVDKPNLILNTCLVCLTFLSPFS